MRPASAGRLECAGRKILIVTRIVPKNFSNSLVIQKPRNVHGRLDFLDLLVVAVNVRIAVPFARLRVPDPVGNPHRRSEEHTSELQSPCNLVCRLLLEKKKK